MEDPEIVESICDHIIKYGTIKGCTILANLEISDKTIKRALDYGSEYYLEDFAKEVYGAFRTYSENNRHPSDDPELKSDAYNKLKYQIKYGKINECSITYNGKGRIEKKTYCDKSLSPEEIRLLWGQGGGVSKNFEFVLGNFHEFLVSRIDDENRDEISIVMKYLSEFKDYYENELIQNI